MTTYWICVAHRFAVPAVECGARGESYTAGDKHCRDTQHPIVTTTRRELADRLAAPVGDQCTHCHRRIAHDETTEGGRCGDCTYVHGREARA